MRIDRKKVRIAMITGDFTQKALAGCTGISRATINGICNGRSCSDDTANKIATALNVPLSEIIAK